jgi:hypothetical protein
MQDVGTLVEVELVCKSFGDKQAAFRNGQGREIPAEDGPRGGAL